MFNYDPAYKELLSHKNLYFPVIENVSIIQNAGTTMYIA